jgi:hypothetical protein
MQTGNSIGVSEILFKKIEDELIQIKTIIIYFNLNKKIISFKLK